MIHRMMIWLPVWLMLLAACQDEDVGALRRELEAQAERLAALEAWQQEVNGNIAALQVLVEALRTNKSITSVTETANGYTLVLSDQTVLNIYHGLPGKDGEDGRFVMPAVAVRDSSDGHAYWTVDGKLLQDIRGNAVRADGDKGSTGPAGEQGIPGITPQLRINPDSNEWEISSDGGKSWNGTGMKATGEKGETGGVGPAGPVGPAGIPGNSVFAEDGVIVTDDYVEFVLADATGSRFRVPRSHSFSLLFPRGTTLSMPLCVVREIPFIISGEGGNPVVTALGNGYWGAEVRMATERPDSGVVVVTAAGVAGKAAVMVLLEDGTGMVRSWRLELTALPTARMIRIPAGGLEMIGVQATGWKVTEFWLGETEVTCRQYCDFLNAQTPVLLPEQIRAMGDTAWLAGDMWDVEYSPAQERWIPGVGIVRNYDYPVGSVSWYGAAAYCRWYGGCLPTEAQWEYAAWGAEGSPWRDKYGGYLQLTPERCAWYAGNSAGGESQRGELPGAHPVAKGIPNWLGLYDVAGNVEEWCRDRVRNDVFWSYPVNGLTDKTDPQGEGIGGLRVVCGGGFYTPIEDIEINKHRAVLPLAVGMGFRMAYQVK